MPPKNHPRGFIISSHDLTTKQKVANSSGKAHGQYKACLARPHITVKGSESRHGKHENIPRQATRPFPEVSAALNALYQLPTFFYASFFPFLPTHASPAIFYPKPPLLSRASELLFSVFSRGKATCWGSGRDRPTGKKEFSFKIARERR